MSSSTTTNLRISQGSGVAWKFNASNAQKHQVRDATRMGLFSSGLRSPGGSYTRRFGSSGRYPYIDPVSGQDGVVSVPVTVSPSRGTQTAVRWSKANAPKGFVFDVQIERPNSSSFVDWRTGVTSLTAAFHPKSQGSFGFRARLRSLANQAHSEWSPPAIFKAE
jgi:hypothetical protein